VDIPEELLAAGVYKPRRVCTSCPSVVSMKGAGASARRDKLSDKEARGWQLANGK
jgi:hypothetical protein